MAFSRRKSEVAAAPAAGFAAASFNRFKLANAMAQSVQDYKAPV